jgi:heme A synthase
MGGAAVAATLLLQWLVGPVMVLLGFPLLLATAHNALAALLVLCMIALLRFLHPPRIRSAY